MKVYKVDGTVPDEYQRTNFELAPLTLEHWEYEGEFTFRTDLGSPPPISDRVAMALPSLLKYSSETGLIPDYIAYLGAAVVSTKFRNIINNLEVDRHGFYEIDIENSRADILKYFIMNIAPIGNALDEQASALEWYTIPGHTHIPPKKRHLKGGGAGIVFKEPAVQNRHFWRSIDAPIFGSRFASERFKYELDSGGIVGVLFDLCRPA